MRSVTASGPTVFGTRSASASTSAGKRVRKVVLGHDHVQVDAGVLESPQDLEDVTRRVPRGGGRPVHLGRHHLPRHGAALVPRWDEQLVKDPAIEGDHVSAEAAVALEASHDALEAALQDPDDAPLGPLRRGALHPHHDPVSVEGLLQVHGGDVDVGLARAPLVGDHETEAARVAAEPASHQVHPGGQADPRSADLHDLPRLDEAAQLRRQLDPLFFLEAEPARDLPDRHRSAILVQQLQHTIT